MLSEHKTTDFCCVVTHQECFHMIGYGSCFRTLIGRHESRVTIIGVLVALNIVSLIFRLIDTSTVSTQIKTRFPRILIQEVEEVEEKEEEKEEEEEEKEEKEEEEKKEEEQEEENNAEFQTKIKREQ